tara:strand:- start:42 stop:320 length:279 start_codon:yes stop_codon:yes gene_type:complete
MTTKYFIIREAKCNENEVYSRTLASNVLGYKNLEEAKKELHKLNEIEQLEALQDEQTEMLQAKLNGNEYVPPKDDGYHHVNVVVSFKYHPIS